MKRYKHYSFDLWQTLIKSNPLFKIRRAEYFYTHHNRTKSVQEIENIIREIDLMSNSVCETTGRHINDTTLYAMVLHRLGFDSSTVTMETLMQINYDMHDLFLKYPPELYSRYTEPTLLELGKTSTLSILSNTAFVKGNTLELWMHKIGLRDKFQFLLFSDEMALSKPNQSAFKYMIHEVTDADWLGCKKEDIIHVGDNPRADIEGAKGAGIDAFLINSNDKTIIDLL